ncbi:MAG TPA: CvpA family protein [Dongiaceae bacterium]|jgi:uncharacterized membrane protein required for colicin V production|nr:CvpA family protein [Dongiaceae bacterium]
MTIWILALVLLASVAFVGFNQGAIRAAMSLIGLITASLVTLPLSKPFTPVMHKVLGIFGVINPIAIWLVTPVVVFAIVLIIFKSAAFALHRKIEVYYKYKAGDLRLALWERMNKRLGLCVGTINGLVYLVLISMLIYVMSYWTIQMTTPESNSKVLAVLNRMGQDLQATGFIKAARAADPMPDDYYATGDLMGLLYHNPDTGDRLVSYPAYLALFERQEFATLAGDQPLKDAFAHQSGIGAILDDSQVQTITHNPDLLNDIWTITQPNLQDLTTYLQTGKSAKYDEAILGRWNFSMGGSLALLRQAKPDLSASQLKALRGVVAFAYKDSSFVAAPGHEAFLKGIKWIGTNRKPTDPIPAAETLTGEWQSEAGKYTLALGNDRKLTATVKDDRIEITSPALEVPMAFTRQD